MNLAKITKVIIGYGGYQDVMFGVTIRAEGGEYASNFSGTWGTRSESAKFTESDWLKQHAKTLLDLKELMDSAKVSDAQDLVGKPVWVNNGEIVRIATEAI